MIFLKKLSFIPVTLLLVLVFSSCDNDYNTIGGELLGNRFDSLPRYDAMVRAYNVDLGPVQTNGLPANLVGVYQDPVYGEQTASVLTQLQLPTTNPTFGDNPVVDSVTLDLPYFSTQIDQDEDNNPVYRLDSVFGEGTFRLKVSRSNYFLNDYDPEDDFQTRQKYYSDLGPTLVNNNVGTALYDNPAFKPSADVVSYYGVNTEGAQDTLNVAPRLRIKLSADVFQQMIIDQEGNSVLSNNNNFKNYFRGIYIQAESTGNTGTMSLLNFANADAGVTIYYTSTVIDYNDSDADGDLTEVVEIPQTYKLSIGNTVNTFDEDLPAEIQQAIGESDSIFGAENLYLKGGEGSMAVIELFEDEAELQALRANNWLINEANLIFYVNQDEVEGGKSEPSRLYIYNLKTNDRLVDYVIDPTFSQTSPATSVAVHSGILVRDEDENGIRYKMRITRTVNQLLSEDSTSVKLGLVVTQNINIVSNASLKEPIGKIDRVPTATVITPKGTVLYGNLADDPNKRLKLQIYYTENNN